MNSAILGEGDYSKLSAEVKRKLHGDGLLLLDLHAGFIPLLWKLQTLYEDHIILGRAEDWARALKLAPSVAGERWIDSGWVPYCPWAVLEQWPPLPAPSYLFVRCYRACQHCVAVLYSPFQSNKRSFPPAGRAHIEVWDDHPFDLCRDCAKDKLNGLPQA